MTPLEPQEARRAVERVLRSPITDAEWQHLVDRRYVDEITHFDDAYTASEAVSDAAAEIRRGRRTWGQRVCNSAPRPRFVQSALAQARNEALSLALAADAANDGRVSQFRYTVLDHRLLTLAGIEAWIKEQAEKELAESDDPDAGWPRPAVLYPRHAKRGDTVNLKLTRRNMVPEGDLLDRPLMYPIEGSEHPAGRGVEPGGVLAWLRNLSEQLAEEYDWQPAEAVGFVLAGLPPDRPALRVTRDVGQRRRGGPISAKIHLEVDLTTSSTEVAEAYRAVQREILGDKQYRSLSEKALNLAVFLHANQPRPKWSELMVAWNRARSDREDWQFSDWRRFQRDAVQAHDRLFDPLRESLTRRWPHYFGAEEAE
jgi:hypothetical protein